MERSKEAEILHWKESSDGSWGEGWRRRQVPYFLQSTLSCNKGPAWAMWITYNGTILKTAQCLQMILELKSGKILQDWVCRVQGSSKPLVTRWDPFRDRVPHLHPTRQSGDEPCFGEELGTCLSVAALLAHHSSAHPRWGAARERTKWDNPCKSLT